MSDASHGAANARSRRVHGRSHVPPMCPALALMFAALAATPQVLAQTQEAAAPAAPATHQALNPPLCAANLMDILKHTTRTAVEIVYATTTCAEEKGWSGLDAGGARRENWPFHNQFGCAALVSIILSNTASSFADGFSMSQTCFHVAEPCGVSISQATSQMADVTLRLETAVLNCALPWEVPPYSAVDYPIAGFACWQACLGTIQRIVKSAKSIDTAISVCGDFDNMPEPPTEDGPSAGAGAGAGNGTSDDGSDGNLSASGNGTDLGASLADKYGWSALEQPQPFSAFSKHLGAPIERRLSDSLDTIAEFVNAEDGTSDPELKASLMDLIADLRVELAGIPESSEATILLP